MEFLIIIILLCSYIYSHKYQTFISVNTSLFNDKLELGEMGVLDLSLLHVLFLTAK